MKRREDGRFQIQVCLGTDENGKRIRKSVYGTTQKEAKEKAEALRLSLGRGIKNTEVNTKLSKWIDLFLLSEKQRLSKTVYGDKKYKLKRFEEYAGANTLLVDVRPFLISNFLYMIAEEGKAEKTIKEYRNAISQLFKFARMNEGIASNPCEAVRLPHGEKKKERRALTSEEQKRLANLPDTIYPGKAMALICMWAGLRKGEATALLWSDIDFKNNTIRVNKSWDYKTETLKEPKTNAGIRLVPLLPCLADYLKTLPKDSDYVFGKRLGSWEWERELAHILQYLESEYGNTDAEPIKNGCNYIVYITIEPFTWHELRHTFCTLLYDNDIPLKVAMLWMGHKSQDMTAKIYTHLSQEKEQTAIQSIMRYGSQMVVNGS